MSIHKICWSASVALSLTGLALATYLSVTYLSGADLACGVDGGCGAVTTSEYSRFLGIPVALLGVGGYAALLLGCLAALGLPQPPAMLRWGLAGIACTGFAFSAYLTATQAFLIGSYCVYCLTSASLMTALMALTVLAAVTSRSIFQ
ncbi:MAG: vitamin K epoxide reductase family protein [Chloroflexi bacterium]|nr:vitamin K epoxide reductase family protein [Chloroflexota bacterium]